ncbi:MAG TPA: NADH:flavin oxidoreductase [Acidimicrobiales bacterium]|nr:NADH:flavin oxidoreductase [Acidimicrobiales bacterium]
MIQVRKLRTAEDFLAHVASLGVTLPFVEDPPAAHADHYAILPMEGWDGTEDGKPTELVLRRWRRFGEGGAGLVWGEATAVRADGRANPHQLLIGPEVAALRDAVGDRVRRVGLQLTHSGRYAVTGPLVAYNHPLLDARAAAPVHVLSDGELDDLVLDFGRAAAIARDAGFDFVDVKACHGYLGHELLSAVDRPGSYGGASLHERTTFLRRCVEAVRSAAPGIDVAVRFSAFDLVPHRPADDTSIGEPEPGATAPYRYAFGGDGTGLGIDLAEPEALLDLLVDLDVSLVCITAGSPYYVPHVQRPAFFPPSDGYLPPEDPLVGVARLLAATAELKAHRPELTIVGTGYSYLQEWLPHVAAGVLRPSAGIEAGHGGADWIGLGRMALSYHDLPDDLRNGKPLDRRRICRTFSDCTTAPRNGLVSGCWPLDPFYKLRPDRPLLAAAKKASRTSVADE